LPDLTRPALPKNKRAEQFTHCPALTTLPTSGGNMAKNILPFHDFANPLAHGKRFFNSLATVS
jgi:hypothetical protein